jgi:hypothetical protein
VRVNECQHEDAGLRMDAMSAIEVCAICGHEMSVDNSVEDNE